MLKKETDVRDWYDQTFGPGWKTAFASSAGLTRQSVTNAKPGTPTYTLLETTAEFMWATTSNRWPARWSLLKKLRKEKLCS